MATRKAGSDCLDLCERTVDQRAVIQHIVIVRWRPGTTEDQVLEAFGHARHLLDEIDGVQRLTIGRNRGPSDHGFTHALIVNLPDEDALRSYLDHPVRKRYLAEHLAPIEEQRIEIDVPVDMSLRPTPVATGNGAPASGWDRRSTGDQQSSSRAAAYLSPRRAAFVYAFVMSG